ncbi:hypothetical protein ONE63_003576 [Megalurothrips usitatus]|uniref:Uncharacterized protein n=1 Tax=Megalurothrips usitatus TaxID=439358 RepID=A0AAV7X5Y3_9NEOP|nr:hypothetical protein ONE63_003576 [Megalurothrips usitatus]
MEPYDPETDSTTTFHSDDDEYDSGGEAVVPYGGGPSAVALRRHGGHDGTLALCTPGLPAVRSQNIGSVTAIDSTLHVGDSTRFYGAVTVNVITQPTASAEEAKNATKHLKGYAYLTAFLRRPRAVLPVVGLLAIIIVAVIVAVLTTRTTAKETPSGASSTTTRLTTPTTPKPTSTSAITSTSDVAPDPDTTIDATTSTSTSTTTTVATTTVNGGCRKDEFHCSSDKCINLAKKCDGRSDCNDETDENPYGSDENPAICDVNAVNVSLGTSFMARVENRAVNGELWFIVCNDINERCTKIAVSGSSMNGSMQYTTYSCGAYGSTACTQCTHNDPADPVPLPEGILTFYVEYTMSGLFVWLQGRDEQVANVPRPVTGNGGHDRLRIRQQFVIDIAVQYHEPCVNSSYFQCHNGECIDSSLICNGDPDNGCVDGSHLDQAMCNGG